MLKTLNLERFHIDRVIPPDRYEIAPGIGFDQVSYCRDETARRQDDVERPKGGAKRREGGRTFDEIVVSRC